MDNQLIVNRLRGRGCWSEAVSFLASSAESNPAIALNVAALLVEKYMFTLEGWQDAEKALAHAAQIAQDQEQIGAIESERAFFFYIRTLLGGMDQSDNARNALEQADLLLSNHSPHRPLLEFRRGLAAENLNEDLHTARVFYSRAHSAAESIGDALLLSYTWRHLGSVFHQEGDVHSARKAYEESLNLREASGFIIGIAPALVTLASVCTEDDASRLLSEATRLVRAFGGVPVWLAAAMNKD